MLSSLFVKIVVTIVVIASPSASSVSIFAILVLTIPRLRRKGSRNQLREWVDDVPNYHKSQRDQPIELVEQFQVGSTIQNEALVEKLIRWTFIGFLGCRFVSFLGQICVGWKFGF